MTYVYVICHTLAARRRRCERLHPGENGGGRAEIEAAQIRPLEKNGPDTVQNGLALSGTVHWMFDRGLISLSDELDVLVSRQVNDPDSVWGLVNKNRRALAPVRAMDRPHPHFLFWHREHCFKR
jgi:putative restriction endonuclease